MADSPADALKRRMASQSAKQSVKAGVDVSAEKTGIVTGPAKVPTAEEKTRKAKAEDVEDTREETSGDERHDLVTATEPNIPPSIVQERLRNGQNPATGEPWTREERMRYDRQNEQIRQIHARAVRESEEKMRKEAAENAPGAPIQPVVHTPTAHLTQGQRAAMQKAQDSGKGPVAQAAARDFNHPDELGKRQAEARMTDKTKQREDAGVTEDVETAELNRAEAEDREEERKDADVEQAELDEQKRKASER